MWSLYENEKELKPLIFTNGKDQADVVKEVLDAIKEGHKVIFIKGACGTGKSAIALNLARKLGKTSIVVPIKSLQEQYTKDYTGSKYVLKDSKRLKILSIVGRKNFKCRYLEENDIVGKYQKYTREKNANLSDIFYEKKQLPAKRDDDSSCDNIYLPCKIEIKEKNIPRIKDYLKLNPLIKTTDFENISDVKRMSVAPVCPYWSPILPEEFEKKFKDSKRIKYKGLNNRHFVIHQRANGCPYYEQYSAYEDADVIIFNSAKYIIETILDRKPSTEVEIIDECDDFLDSFANQEQISLNRLFFSLNSIYINNDEKQKTIKTLIDITNNLKNSNKYTDSKEIFPIDATPVQELLSEVIHNTDFLDLIEDDETSYLNHLDKVAKVFSDSFKETFFSFEKKDTDLILHLVTTNLAQKLKEMIEKNNVFIMMSGTIHSENVLKTIFGLEKFKIIDAETKPQGNLIKCRYGYEMDCSYSNFQSNRITREQYLRALSKSVSCAKRPTLVHVNSFSDLPIDYERTQYSLDNLMTQSELIKIQDDDPFQKRILDFRNKKTDLLFTTKCSRGIDFPGDICNSIVITRFPYPNISSIFWKILKKTRPSGFMTFYMDKSRRELLQKIYRGLRSKDDTVYLLSPDSRVLDFEIS